MYREEFECMNCDNHQERIEDQQYWIKAILEQLYSSESFSAEDFEFCLEELCNIVGIKLPKSDLSIDRKRVNVVRSLDLDSWKKWNNQYIKQLACGE